MFTTEEINKCNLLIEKYKQKHPMTNIIVDYSNPITVLYLLKDSKQKNILNLDKYNFKFFITKLFEINIFFTDIENLLFLKSDVLKKLLKEYNDDKIIPAFYRNDKNYKQLNKIEIEKLKQQQIDNQLIINIYTYINNKYVKLNKIDFSVNQDYYIQNTNKYIYNSYIKLNIDEIKQYFNYKIIADLKISLLNNNLQDIQNESSDNFEDIKCKIKEILHLLPENYYNKYINNNDYSNCVIEYIRLCRFLNIDGYFKMGEKIFNKQQHIFNIFNTYRYYLIGGGTGIGKTAIIPLLFLYFNTSEDILSRNRIDYTDYKTIICEPRISTTTNPYQFLRFNTGIDYKFSCDNERENFLDTYSSYNINLYKDNSLIMMKYQDYINKYDDNYLIKYLTDGTLLNLLLKNPDNTLKDNRLIVIDEVHENSINTIISMIIISTLIEEDDKLIYKKRKLTNLRIMLITAMCQLKEKEIFHNLFPGLYDIDDFPNKTDYKVDEIYENPNNILKCIHSTKNGLIFISTSLKIDEYYNKLTKLFPSLIILKLTRETNKTIYNSSIENYIELNVFKFNKKYLILATNIAESSITFPKLDYVIDFGEQFNIKYDVVTKIKISRNELMTKNSWVQRIGRVGRKQNGIYYGLYDKNRLIEYNNKIINENIYYNLLKLIYHIKDKNRINIIFNKLKNYFDAKNIIEIYENDFNNLGWITNYEVTPELKKIIELQYKLINLFKFDENLSFQLSVLLYYCYTNEMKKFVLYNYKIPKNESIISNILNSDEYKIYSLNYPNYRSDIVSCLDFIKIYNDKYYLDLIYKNINKNLSQDIDNILDFSKNVSSNININKAILYACYFSKTNRRSQFKYSNVNNFKIAFTLELDNKLQLLHTI
jgi:hypothetical protein